MAEFTEYAPGTPSWVDLQSSDIDGGVEFYGGLFGWDVQDLGPDAGGYRFFLKDGKTVAGGGPRMNPDVPSAWVTFVSVANADETAAKVTGSGGKVLAEPMDVMTAGRMAVFADPTGAVFAVWQPRDHTGAQLANEPGTFGWNECQTHDAERARSFYKSVFGWEGAVDPEMGGYTVFQLDGKMIGGMANPEMLPKEVPANWMTYFGVDDADAAVATVKKLGGSVMLEPMDVPRVGRFAIVSDPQGAAFAIIKSESQPEG